MQEKRHRVTCVAPLPEGHKKHWVEHKKYWVLCMVLVPVGHKSHHTQHAEHSLVVVGRNSYWLR